MANLEDLIGVSLNEISDEELEKVIMHGRLAREESAVTKKATTAKKTAAKKCSISDEELAEFE
jgi:hypothetical protein